MVRPAPMQTVELVELDEGASPPPVAAGLSRADRWRLVRRGAPVPVALLLVLVGMQALEVARDRAALAALAKVPGVVRPVDPDVRVLWTPDEALASLFWWDVRGDGSIVGLERPADGSQALVAVDELTGDLRWSTPLGSGRPSEVDESPVGGCAPVPHVSGRVACLVSDGHVSYAEMSVDLVPGELSTVVVLNTADGSVVAEHPAPGAVAFTALPDTAVIAVQGADDTFTLVGTGLLDGEPRWRTTLPAPTEQARADTFVDGSISLFGTLDGLGAVVSGQMLLLGHSGEVLRAGIDASNGWRVDAATRAVSAISVDAAGFQRTTFLGREGADVTVPDTQVWLSADDGSVPGLVLMSGSSLRAYDRTSATPRWSVENLQVSSALVLRGRVYAGSGRGLVAIDARTGDELWRTSPPEGRTMGGLVTDGRHLLSSQDRQGSSGEIVGELAAYRLDDGREDWRVDLPGGLSGIWSTGSTLLGWSETGTSVLG